MWDLGWTHSTISPQCKNLQSCDSYTAATHRFLILRTRCPTTFVGKTFNTSRPRPPIIVLESLPTSHNCRPQPRDQLLNLTLIPLVGPCNTRLLVWYCPPWAVVKPARIFFRAPPQRPHINGVLWLLIFKINLLYLFDVGLGLNPLNNAL